MDPYQGLKVGARDQYEGHFFDDFGMGIWGYAGMALAEMGHQTGLYMPGITKGRGVQGVRRMLKTQKMRAMMSVGANQTNFNRMMRRGSRWAGRSREVRQYRRLRAALFDRDITGRYPGNPLSALYEKSGGNFRRLQARYGTGAARRIWGSTQLGKFSRITGIVPLFMLGAQLAGGVMEGIMSFEPPGMEAGGPSPEFGGMSYNVPDTRTAYTQRQASLMAIHQSGMQARAAIGNEASLIH